MTGASSHSSSYVLAHLDSGDCFLSSRTVEALGMRVESVREVELRCPTGPRKLFAKLRLAGVHVPVTSDNLIEMGCQDCRRRMRSENRDVKLVLHRFDITGELIETVVVDRDVP